MISAFIALLLAAPPTPRSFDGQDPISLAADVICGEAGSNETLSTAIAHVIDNRMAHLAGRRPEKLVSVLTQPHQFNGRCRLSGGPTDWQVGLANALVTGSIRQFWRPRWLTADVRWFTEAATARKWTARRRPAWTRGLRKVRMYEGVVFFRKAGA